MSEKTDEEDGPLKRRERPTFGPFVIGPFFRGSTGV
jgi:hypothetical protein